MAELLASRSPKRKRADLVPEPRSSLPLNAQRLHKTIFSFEPPTSSPKDGQSDDGGSSPRTKVALELGNLDLEDGTVPTSTSGVIPALQLAEDTASSGCTTTTSATAPGQTVEISVSSSLPLNATPDNHSQPEYATTSAVFMFNGPKGVAEDHSMLADDDLSIARKRLKVPDPEISAQLHLAHPGGEGAAVAEPMKQDFSGDIVLEAAIDDKVVQTPSSSGFGSLTKSYPSINRLSESKSRNRKKLPSSSLSREKKSAASASKLVIEDQPIVVDPVRAALTWQEDEITIYDPEDKDDDGTGINGIGFKPSAAVAHQRAQKRRQQLVEYRKREEGEARARRNQRRREQLGAPPPLERKHSVVRVHFSEAEPTAFIMT